MALYAIYAILCISLPSNFKEVMPSRGLKIEAPTFFIRKVLWWGFQIPNGALNRCGLTGHTVRCPRGPILGKGQFTNSKTGWDTGFPVPGALKLDHLQPIKPLLFPNFYTFFTFILGGQFLLLRRAYNWKVEFTKLQNWMRQRASTAWGIQTGPFAAH